MKGAADAAPFLFGLLKNGLKKRVRSLSCAVESSQTCNQQTEK